MAITDLLKYGNELEMSGVVMANGLAEHIIMFPDAPKGQSIKLLIQPSHEDWKELLNQLDTLGIEGLNKTILRKSQRQIEQQVSWNVFRRDNYACRYCADDNTPLTVDHLVRWENMGASVEDNLLTACRKCNKTRGDTEFYNWVLSDYYKKAIQGFNTPGLLTNTNPTQAHAANLEQWEKARQVPLRNTRRSR